jgi:hypothetical protein
MIMQTLARLAETDTELRAKLVEHVFPEKDAGGLAGLAREAFANPEGAKEFLEAGASILQMALGFFMPNAQPATGGNALQQQGNPLQQTLSIIVNDLKRNRRVGRSADAIEDLIRRSPEVALPLQQTLEKSDAEVVADISQVAREDLTAYTHAVGWIAKLRLELTGEDDEDDEDDEAERTSAEGGAIAASDPSIVDMANEVRG